MITVFTPTYNRGYIISKLYESLKSQSYTDFEWLIIDDGSSDDTENVVRNFIAEGKITIRYYKTPNGGKHRAINRGVPLANGELFFIVDSDDFLTPDALQRISFHYDSVKDDINFAGVCGLRKYPDGTINGLKKEFGILDSSPDKIQEYLSCDKAEVWRTDILKQFPFPEFDGEKFISEGIVWNRIGAKFKLRYFFEPIYVCEYLSDGLTKSIIRQHRNSPLGTLAVYRQRIAFAKSAKEYLKSSVNYWRYALGVNTIPQELKAPLLSYLAIPLAIIIRVSDNKRI